MEWIILGAVLIGTFVASYYLAPKPSVEDRRAETLDKFRFPRSNEGDPVPIVFGTARLRAPNTLWYGDYKTSEIATQVSTGYFTRSKKQVIGFNYFLGLHLGLCLGPNVTLKRIWAGKHELWNGTANGENVAVNISKDDIYGGWKQGGGIAGLARFYSGSFTQAQDAYLALHNGPEVPRYGGICHIVFPSFYWGSSPSIDAIHFELQRFTDYFSTGKGTIGSDSNPMQILYDLLTQKWGRLGLDTAEIDNASWIAAENTLFTEQFGLSLLVTSKTSGREVMEEILRHIDGVLYQDPQTGKIKAKLIRKDYNLADVITLDQSNVHELRSFTKTTWDGTYNEIRVTFPNRAKDYEDSVALTQDAANINYQQKIRSSAFSMPACTEGAVAGKIAARSLAMMSVPLYRCELVTTRYASSLRPGDVFKLTWPPYGIADMVMRVQRIDYGELTDGRVRIVAAQDQFATANTVFAPPGDTLWSEENKAPQPVTVRKVFEAPPYFRVKTGLEFDERRAVTVAKAPSAYSQAYTAWIDADERTIPLADASYNMTARYVGGTTLLASLGRDTGLIPSLLIGSLSGGTLKTFSGLSDLRDGPTLFMIDDEFFMYTSFTDNLNGTYTLNNVYRGLLDSAMEGHLDNAMIFFFDGPQSMFDANLHWPSTAALTLRLLDQTGSGILSSGSAPFDLLNPTIAPWLNKRAVRPAPPDYTTVKGARSGTIGKGADTQFTVAWRERNRNADTIRVVNDTTDTQEAGVKYRIFYRYNSGIWVEVPNIVGTSSPISAFTGTLEVRVDAFLTIDGVDQYSWSFDEVFLNVVA